MGSGSRNIVIGVISIIVVMTSCLPDPIAVREAPIVPKIVVTSKPNGGQVIILLTRSVSALDASDDSDYIDLLAENIIGDATVSIESRGKSYPLDYVNGVYVTSRLPFIPGEGYTLHVFSPTYGTVTATTIMKLPVRFKTVATKVHIMRNDSLANVEYTFIDAAGQPNWYLVTGQRITHKNLKETILNPRVTTKLRDDINFDGETISGNFDILFDEVRPRDTVQVILSSVDQDYYNYIKLRQDTQFGIAAAIGEPINYPSNVEGGLGFFNLYFPDTRIFILKYGDF